MFIYPKRKSGKIFFNTMNGVWYVGSDSLTLSYGSIDQKFRSDIQNAKHTFKLNTEFHQHFWEIIEILRKLPRGKEPEGCYWSPEVVTDILSTLEEENGDLSQVEIDEMPANQLIEVQP